MRRNEQIDPVPNLEDVEFRQRQRTREEDEGVNYDDDLDLKRVLDETVEGRDVGTMPIDRIVERDRPEAREMPIDEEAREEKRRRQYEGGAEIVSETD